MLLYNLAILIVGIYLGFVARAWFYTPYKIYIGFNYDGKNISAINTTTGALIAQDSDIQTVIAIITSVYPRARMIIDEDNYKEVAEESSKGQENESV